MKRTENSKFFNFQEKKFDKFTNKMAGDAVVSSGRPQLKGLHHATIRTNLAVAIGLSLAVTFAYKFLVNDPKKRDYAEFYKNYDAEAAFQRMRKAGVFHSAPADE